MRVISIAEVVTTIYTRPTHDDGVRRVTLQVLATEDQRAGISLTVGAARKLAEYLLEDANAATE